MHHFAHTPTTSHVLLQVEEPPQLAASEQESAAAATALEAPPASSSSTVPDLVTWWGRVAEQEYAAVDGDLTGFTDTEKVQEVQTAEQEYAQVGLDDPAGNNCLQHQLVHLCPAQSSCQACCTPIGTPSRSPGQASDAPCPDVHSETVCPETHHRAWYPGCRPECCHLQQQ
jgi:Tfp pilus assembly protein PilW